MTYLAFFCRRIRQILLKVMAVCDKIFIFIRFLSLLLIDSEKIEYLLREILKKVTILLRHIQGALEMQGVAPGENNSWQHQA